MSKPALRRPPSRPATLQTVLRDVYSPPSEYLKELLHQAIIKANAFSVIITQTQVGEQNAETLVLQNAIAETREKTERVRLEREQVTAEKQKLTKELERSLKQIDISKQKRFNASLEAAIVNLKGETAKLKAGVEDIRDDLDRKRGMLQMRENEVRLMTKELEKINKQRSILLDKAKVGGSKVPIKPMASKSQMESFMKESMIKGIQKETIRPFNSFGFALNMHQSTGPIKVPSGMNTSRSSNPKEVDAPSTRRKVPTPEVKPSSPSVE